MNTQSINRSPAEFGMWLFIFADMCIFAMYFGVLTWDRFLFPDQFVQGQATLNNYLGALNTIVLLVSSFFVATAIQAARERNLGVYQRCIKLTIICGCIFLVVKIVEYTEKFQAGFHIATNEFYRNYFGFTAFHMLHVIVGLSLLTYLLFNSKKAEHIGTSIQNIEGVGLYWHMVDLLWIVLFSLFYLVA